MKTEIEIEDQNKKEDIWGYAVCFGIVISFISSIGHVNSFGIIYNDFMIDTASSARSFTMAHGVFAIMLALGGIILDILQKRLSLRTGGLIGAFIMIIGSFSTVFISNTDQLSITFGLLQGIGFGMIVPASYSTFNYYFTKKRRTTVMSVCKALQGIVLMFWPHLIRKSMIEYGFKGTLLILSAIALHTIPGMLVMKTKFGKSSATLKTANNERTDEKTKHENIVLYNQEEDDKILNTNGDSRHKNDRDNDKPNSNLLSLKMLRDPFYCNICIGQSFVNFSDLTFFVLQPLLLLQYGYDTKEVATCISVCGISDVVGRCSLALISYYAPIDTRLLYYISTFLTMFIRIAMLQVRKFFWMILVTILLGLLRACLHVTSPLVISNHVSHEDFPGAYALFMLAAGVVNVTFSPLIGGLRDVYADYVPAFYALTLCCLPCLLFWPVEYFYYVRSIRSNKK